MKKIFAAALLLAGFAIQPILAQKVWTEPATVTNPADSVKILIDLTLMDCQSLVGSSGPLYLWSWLPAEPVSGNGDWNNSNTDNAWTNESPDVWSITILPTDFYGVVAQDFYDSDMHFLAKELYGGGGVDCAAGGTEFKTEDLVVEVNPPGMLVRKVYTFPDTHDGDTVSIKQTDVFTLLYENSLEEKVTMQNVTDLAVYARAFDTDGNQYRPATISQVRNHPELAMTSEGSLFKWTIIPERVFNIPVGKTLSEVRLQIMKPDLVDSDDAVDNLWEFFFRCN